MRVARTEKGKRKGGEGKRKEEGKKRGKRKEERGRGGKSSLVPWAWKS